MEIDLKSILESFTNNELSGGKGINMDLDASWLHIYTKKKRGTKYKLIDKLFTIILYSILLFDILTSSRSLSWNEYKSFR